MLNRIQIRKFVCDFPVFSSAAAKYPSSLMLSRLPFLKKFFGAHLLKEMKVELRADRITRITSEELIRVFYVLRQAGGATKEDDLKRIMLFWPHILTDKDQLNNFLRNLSLYTSIFPRKTAVGEESRHFWTKDSKKQLSRYLFAEARGKKVTPRLLSSGTDQDFCETLGCTVEDFCAFRNVAARTNDKQRVKSSK